VFPETKQVELKHQGHTIYEVPACEQNKVKVAEPLYMNPTSEGQRDMRGVEISDCAPGEGYTILRIYDTAQNVLNPVTESYEDKPIPVGFVGDDLTKIFGTGFAMIAGDTPTPEELAALRKELATKFLRDVQQANDWHSKGEGMKIRRRHRVAAKGIGDEGLPWVRGIQQRVMKDCVACGKGILTKAIVCEHCGTNLVRFYADMKFEPNEAEDPVVYNFFMNRKRAAQAKPKPPSKAEMMAKVNEGLDAMEAERAEKQTVTVDG
jgi:hypothetical protein